MKVYREIFYNSIKSSIAYKHSILLSLFFQTIFLFIEISIWTALYHNIDSISSHSGPITLKDMITYTIIRSLMGTVVRSVVTSAVDKKIKTGQIAMDLIKPINFKLLIFSDLMGRKAGQIVFTMLPIMIVFIMIYGIALPSASSMIMFLVTVILSSWLYFLMSYIVGLVGFWYMSVWHLGRVLSGFIDLFSGNFLPLWFFPAILYKAASFMPFGLVYYAPLSIYLGKTSLSEAVMIILQQLLWIGILTAVEKLVWLKGINKLVVQGG